MPSSFTPVRHANVRHANPRRANARRANARRDDAPHQTPIKLAAALGSFSPRIRPVVNLNRIYTKSGDAGQTGLGSGLRVSKDNPRVEAYGEVDEANAAIGVAAVAAAAARTGTGQSADVTATKLHALLCTIMNDMFDVGADLCCPPPAPGQPPEAPGSRLRVTAKQAHALELAIDDFNARLAPLTSFVLPGGTPLAAALHVARTAVRRAERRTVTLAKTSGEVVADEVIIYLNRLSDLLFVLARIANDEGKEDVLWTPGGK